MGILRNEQQINKYHSFQGAYGNLSPAYECFLPEDFAQDEEPSDKPLIFVGPHCCVLAHTAGQVHAYGRDAVRTSAPVPPLPFTFSSHSRGRTETVYK